MYVVGMTAIGKVFLPNFKEAERSDGRTKACVRTHTRARAHTHAEQGECHKPTFLLRKENKLK